MMTNFAERTIWTGGSLHMLRDLNSASLDLIYLDPPFNFNRNCAVPVGSAAPGLQGHLDVVRRCLVGLRR